MIVVIAAAWILAGVVALAALYRAIFAIAYLASPRPDESATELADQRRFAVPMSDAYALEPRLTRYEEIYRAVLEDAS